MIKHVFILFRGEHLNIAFVFFLTFSYFKFDECFIYEGASTFIYVKFRLFSGESSKFVNFFGSICIVVLMN